jgi:hypothetical protein
MDLIQKWMNKGFYVDVLDLGKLNPKRGKGKDLMELLELGYTKDEIEQCRTDGLVYWIERTCLPQITDIEDVNHIFEHACTGGFLSDQREYYCFYEAAAKHLQTSIEEIRLLCEPPIEKEPEQISSRQVLDWFSNICSNSNVDEKYQFAFLHNLEEIVNRNLSNGKELPLLEK